MKREVTEDVAAHISMLEYRNLVGPQSRPDPWVAQDFHTFAGQKLRRRAAELGIEAPTSTGFGVEPCADGWNVFCTVVGFRWESELTLRDHAPVPVTQRSWYVRPRRNFMLNRGAQ